MASSTVSPVPRAPLANGGDSYDPSDPDDFPVPPDWIIADPEENKRRILAMLEEGERDIAAGRTYDFDEVMAELDAT
jgi:hypothetical protein